MRDPIWGILKYQGRSMSWLARTTGYAHSYVRKLACGVYRPSSAFRTKASMALMMPESSLFLLPDRSVGEQPAQPLSAEAVA